MPRFNTLHELVVASQAGEVEIGSIDVDNDSVYAYGPVDDEDVYADPEDLFHGSGPEEELVALLVALGLPARRP